MAENTISEDPTKASKRLNHLLFEARRAFTTLGYQHVSIDALSRTSGVSKETIYRHFDDKQQLFRAAMQAAAEPFAQNFIHIFTQPGSADDILERCARMIHDRNRDADNPNPSWLAIGVANIFPELSRLVFFDYVSRIMPLRNYLLDIAKQRGMQADIPLPLVAQFGGLAVGGLGYLMGRASPACPDQTAKRAARLYLYGCASGEDAPPAACDSAQVFALQPVAAPKAIKPHIAELMRVSRDQFYRHGYSGASLDEIGATAKVGRGTLYRHFKNKAGLFRAVMLQSAAELMDGVELTLSTALPLSENLSMAAERITEILQNSEAISLYRTVSAELNEMPTVAAAVYETTHIALQKPLMEYFSACNRSGQLVIEDAGWAAEQFITLALAGNNYLTTNPAPTKLARAHNCRLAISTFLYGFLGQSAK